MIRIKAMEAASPPIPPIPQLMVQPTAHTTAQVNAFEDHPFQARVLDLSIRESGTRRS